TQQGKYNTGCDTSTILTSGTVPHDRTILLQQAVEQQSPLWLQHGREVAIHHIHLRCHFPHIFHGFGIITGQINDTVIYVPVIDIIRLSGPAVWVEIQLFRRAQVHHRLEVELIQVGNVCIRQTAGRTRAKQQPFHHSLAVGTDVAAQVTKVGTALKWQQSVVGADGSLSQRLPTQQCDGAHHATAKYNSFHLFHCVHIYLQIRSVRSSCADQAGSCVHSSRVD